MRRIIVIAVLIVLTVFLPGCDKFKMELERRHLGKERHNQTALVEKASDDKQNDGDKQNNDDKQNNVAASSEKKQIVIRIDLPTDEKIQIRLVKLPVSEENNTDEAVNSPNKALKNDAPHDEVPRNQPEQKVELNTKTSKELETPKSEEPKTEIKTDAEQEPKSEIKTDREEAQPESTPTVIVPARAESSEPILPDANEISALSRFEKPKPAPAEAAVASALTVTPPETIVPSSKTPLKAPLETVKPSSPELWAIPNADYPLRYY